MADMRGLQCECTLQIVFGHRQGLSGQRVHQIEVDVVETRVLRQLHRGFGLIAVVDAAQPLQTAVVETLDAERQPVHAGPAVILETSVLGRAGIGFQGDLAAGREAQPGAGGLQKTVHRRRRKQTGRTAAEEYRLHGTAPDQRQIVIEIGDQRIDVGVERRCALGLVRIEIAVGTFAYAPRQMHVERKWRQTQHRAQRTAARSFSRSCANARPRWLMRFFSDGSNSAAPMPRPGPKTSGSKNTGS